MQPPDHRSSEDRVDDGDTEKLPVIKVSRRAGTLQKKSLPVENVAEGELIDSHRGTIHRAQLLKTLNILEQKAIEKIDTIKTPSVSATVGASHNAHQFIATSSKESSIEAIDTTRMAGLSDAIPIEAINTSKLLNVSPTVDKPAALASKSQRVVIPRGRALLLISILLIIVLNAVSLGYAQFVGPQGWAYVLGGPASSDNNTVIKNILHRVPTPGATGTARVQETPQQYINEIMQHMTLDQKLGQMLIVQFVGSTYTPDLSTMISQYNVGAVLIFAANGNIVDKVQLKDLVQQMQANTTIPLTVAIDQEGGTVDRLKALDGPRPSATEIGATGDPQKAMQSGIQDAMDLAFYGINLNLAPVVDVTNVYNSQLYSRTYGNTAQVVTEMAGAYLQGLQQSGAVLGTLKHFPGLGDVGGDPHIVVPYLSRSLNDLEAIDWAPYRALIQQGNVHAVMVTHEVVRSVDSTQPSSLSSKLVTSILRNDLGFQGVVMTDSLTMEGILAYYSAAQAAVRAIEAGVDLLMGASTPSTVAAMIDGIKQAVNTGEISQQRIDDSVRRLLMLKYEMGLLHPPTS